MLKRRLHKAPPFAVSKDYYPLWSVEWKINGLLNLCLIVSFWGQWKTYSVWFLKTLPLLFVVQFVIWELDVKKKNVGKMKGQKLHALQSDQLDLIPGSAASRLVKACYFSLYVDEWIIVSTHWVLVKIKCVNHEKCSEQCLVHIVGAQKVSCFWCFHISSSLRWLLFFNFWQS